MDRKTKDLGRQKRKLTNGMEPGPAVLRLWGFGFAIPTPLLHRIRSSRRKACDCASDGKVMISETSIVHVPRYRAAQGDLIIPRDYCPVSIIMAWPKVHDLCTTCQTKQGSNSK